MSAIEMRTRATTDLDLTLLVARIALVLVFPISGYYKVTGLDRFVQAMANTYHVPMPELATYLAILVEFLCPLLVALGLFTRWAALVLLLYTLGTSIIAHRFWEFAPPAQFGQLMNFFKNLCMIAGLGLVALLGPGRHAVQPRP